MAPTASTAPAVTVSPAAKETGDKYRAAILAHLARLPREAAAAATIAKYVRINVHGKRAATLDEGDINNGGHGWRAALFNTTLKGMVAKGELVLKGASYSLLPNQVKTAATTRGAAHCLSAKGSAKKVCATGANNAAASGVATEVQASSNPLHLTSNNLSTSAASLATVLPSNPKGETILAQSSKYEKTAATIMKVAPGLSQHGLTEREGFTNMNNVAASNNRAKVQTLENQSDTTSINSSKTAMKAAATPPTGSKEVATVNNIDKQSTTTQATNITKPNQSVANTQSPAEPAVEILTDATQGDLNQAATDFTVYVPSTKCVDGPKHRTESPMLSCSSPSLCSMKQTSRPLAVTAFRTITVPKDTAPSEILHVQLSENHTTIGIVCPAGVRPGDTVVILEPDRLHPPVPPCDIAHGNAQQLLHGLDPASATGTARDFWRLLWPLLEEEGWVLQRQMHFNFGYMRLYPQEWKSLEVAQGQEVLNVHYFETIVAILAFLRKDPKYAEILRRFDGGVANRKKTATTSPQTEQKDRITPFERERTNEKNAGMLGQTMEIIPPQTTARKRKRTTVETVYQLDAWKYTGKREHIEVGRKHQVHALPCAGTHEPGEEEKYRQEKLWEVAPCPSPLTQSSWYEWAKDATFASRFHQIITSSKKELPVVAFTLKKSVAFCLWYYYTKYKPSENYPILKKLMSKRKERENLDECAICGDGGNLLCCETCINSVSEN